MKERDLRPKKNGWAPGFYYDVCAKCAEDFLGDKRARICADCAYAEQDNIKKNDNR